MTRHNWIRTQSVKHYTGAGVLRHMGDDLPTLEVMLPCETGRGRLRARGDAPPTSRNGDSVNFL